VSAYGTVRTLAEHLGMSEAVDLLEQTESEEEKADEKLTGIAVEMYQSADDSEEETMPVGAGSSSRASGESRSRARKKAS
jgi:hypothetical protein